MRQRRAGHHRHGVTPAKVMLGWSSMVNNRGNQPDIAFVSPTASPFGNEQAERL
jgi:hypothetical protein